MRKFNMLEVWLADILSKTKLFKASYSINHFRAQFYVESPYLLSYVILMTSTPGKDLQR